MAPKDDDLGDVYDFLGIAEDAGDKEIQGAFRKGSLKWHPDKNPDDPEAAEKFDRLTRAKELLLDPQRRAAYDQGRKAKRELEERFAQEDEKRRKFREDLESREGASEAARARVQAAEAAKDAKKKHAQMDFAARIRAREAEKAARQAEVAATFARARSAASEARVRVVWRGPGEATVRVEALRKALVDFDFKSITMEGDSTALVQMGSKEEALKAILRCRERKHQLGFRITLEKPEEGAAPAETVEARAPKRPGAPGIGATFFAGAASAPAAAAAAASGPGRPGAPSKKRSFEEFEADMLGDLANLAKAQKTAKAQS